MNEKQLNVLLADDDSDDRDFFKIALDALPLLTKLKTVNDGEQLMNYLSKNHENLPNILFLDINMPRKNGIECLSEIKQNNKLKDLPVVMFSTANSQEKIKLVFKNGANVYLHKPCDICQLKQLLLHVLPIATENVFSNGPIKYILNA